MHEWRSLLQQPKGRAHTGSPDKWQRVIVVCAHMFFPPVRRSECWFRTSEPLSMAGTQFTLYIYTYNITMVSITTVCACIYIYKYDRPVSSNSRCTIKKIIIMVYFLNIFFKSFDAVACILSVVNFLYRLISLNCSYIDDTYYIRIYNIWNESETKSE